ncbi:Flavoprotein monooxygenase [Trichoderma simmonsii]|uniref:Flavoprotein monooxygenase n=1 Tax=Trichoderma simmonsii TaxID=1491479 RepID=A0A8G0PAZ7_9HYPO|nr:Flavoprotein monooxygenase [Trichoderma simmonsii]
MAVTDFKVIIVGGGPVGLTAAHALHKAGIDFTVLERSNEIAMDVGASIALGSATLRVLHQLGLLDQLWDLGGEIGSLLKKFTIDGYKFKSGDFLHGMKKSHGLRPVAFHRAELVQSLYDQLPEEVKPNILTRKKVSDIQSGEKKAKVVCDDGSIYEGDLVLGADGVHSQTRKIMRKLALEADPNVNWDPEAPFTATYRCMWASFKRPTAVGDAAETQHKDSSIMYLVGKERGWIFLYEKLPQPTKERTSYTSEDVEAMGNRFAEYPIWDNLKVKDVFPDRMTGGMSDLQEGICSNWGWGRIVLAGDAIHKVCPNAGLGYQTGVQDVVSLVNNLRQLVVSSEPSMGLSVSTLEALYKSYQSQRWDPLSHDAFISGQVTRIHAWANVWYYLLGRIVLVPHFMDNLMNDWVQAPATSKALAFNFLDAEEPFEGQVPWVHPLKNIY